MTIPPKKPSPVPFFLMVGLILVLLVVGFYAIGGLFRSKLDFAIQFSEAQGIRSGQDVVFRGVTIGRVSSVELHGNNVLVHVSINKNRASDIGSNFRYQIVNKRGITDLSGEKIVRVDPPLWRPSPVAIEPGSIIVGRDSLWYRTQDTIRVAGGYAAKGLEEAQRLLSDAQSSYRSWVETVEGKAFFEHFEATISELMATGRTQWENFQGETLPMLREKAIDARVSLESEGRMEEARKFWERFRSWEQEVEQDAEE